MAIFHEGDMWDVFGKTDLWLFTGNRFVNKRGEITMGRGLAFDVKERFPHVPYALGQRLLFRKHLHLLWQNMYGLITLEVSGQEIGIFQVKDHWSHRADLGIIKYSTRFLREYIKVWQIARVDMNCPGIGYGRLPRSQVLPIVSELPDSVHIWEKDE